MCGCWLTGAYGLILQNVSYSLNLLAVMLANGFDDLVLQLVSFLER